MFPSNWKVMYIQKVCSPRFCHSFMEFHFSYQIIELLIAEIYMKKVSKNPHSKP